MTSLEARRAGYIPLAGFYSRDEQKMLDAVVADMARGNIAFVIIREPSGKMIYRTKEGFRNRGDRQ